jgi:hypothetical protein
VNQIDQKEIVSVLLCASSALVDDLFIAIVVSSHDGIAIC